ncbi:hypothetical protein ACLMJK_008241 [Lecanora helva]
MVGILKLFISSVIVGNAVALPLELSQGSPESPRSPLFNLDALESPRNTRRDTETSSDPDCIWRQTKNRRCRSDYPEPPGETEE